MALPINIDDLINGKTVEWERIEFKKGWNPEQTIKTICAFANDFNNWGGGYVVIGIEEINGRPALPPFGLEINSIDHIQQELIGLCRKIQPNYSPVVEPVDFQTKKILILWCPGGSVRPYKAPDTLGQSPQYFPFIRKNSSTVRPNIEEERELFSMANRIPFDDQVNHHAQLSDLDLSTIKSFLYDIKSDLASQISTLSISQLARQMNIAEGSNENLLPKNVGLLFFAKEPQRFFPSAKIEIVTFKNELGDSFTEKLFSAHLHSQLRSALEYLKDNLVIEKISKVVGQAESNRFFNYPYEAIEEALCNAVYHRGYDDDSTIEVRIYPSHLDIISYPGPLPPLNKQKLKDQQFDVRKYRNRRIGEFLKELRLTEGRATGIPTIKNALVKNGSPVPYFETDDQRAYFKTSFQIHPSFIPSPSDVKDGVGTELVRSRNGKKTMLKPDRDQVGDYDRDQVRVQVSVQANLFIINNLDKIMTLYNSLGEQVGVQVREQVGVQVPSEKIKNLINILKSCQTPKKRVEILHFLKLTNHPKNYKSNVVPLIENGLLETTVPDKPQSSNQKYRTTEKGNLLLDILSEG